MVDKKFLESYIAKSSFQTSVKETKMIEKALKLRENKSNEELMEIREEVALFYLPLIDLNLSHRDDRYFCAMASVHRVIDGIVDKN